MIVDSIEESGVSMFAGSAAFILRVTFFFGAACFLSPLLGFIEVFFGAAFLTAAFFAAGFFTAAFFTATFLTAAFFAAGFFTAVFLTAAFLTAGFFTAAFFGVAFFAAGFLTAAFFGAAFFAAGFFTATFLTAAFFGAAFFAAAFFGAAFFTAAFFGAAFLTAAFFGAAFFTAAFFGAAFFAGARMASGWAVGVAVLSSLVTSYSPLFYLRLISLSAVNAGQNVSRKVTLLFPNACGGLLTDTFLTRLRRESRNARMIRYSAYDAALSTKSVRKHANSIIFFII